MKHILEKGTKPVTGISTADVPAYPPGNSGSAIGRMSRPTRIYTFPHRGFISLTSGGVVRLTELPQSILNTGCSARQMQLLIMTAQEDKQV